MTPRIEQDSSAHRGRRDKGAALVEFALVSVLLFTLVFGIIVYGMSMSFRGTLQQSASEGARAAAAAPRDLAPSPGGRDNSVAQARAIEARDDALDGYGRTCGATEEDVSCTIDFHDCATTGGSVDLPDTSSTPDCITLTLEYDQPYPVDLPLVPSLPLKASSTVQLNDR